MLFVNVDLLSGEATLPFSYCLPSQERMGKIKCTDVHAGLRLHCSRYETCFHGLAQIFPTSDIEQKIPRKEHKKTSKPDCQIRGNIDDNSKIIFLVSQQKKKKHCVASLEPSRQDGSN